MPAFRLALIQAIFIEVLMGGGDSGSGLLPPPTYPFIESGCS